MTLQLINAEPDFEFSLELELGTDIDAELSNKNSDLFCVLREYIEEKALEAAIIEVGSKPRGIFNNANEIENELYATLDRIVEEQIIGKLKLVVSDENGFKTRASIRIPKDVYILGRECEQSYVDAGRVILISLEEFLNKGCWHVGTRDTEGHITELSMDALEMSSKDVDSILLWFGLNNEPAIDIWAVSSCDFSSDFWFNDFWLMDWTTLFNGNEYCYTIWMFTECGMDEPSEAFERVHKTCPIELTRDDTNESIKEKIGQLIKNHKLS